MKIQRTKDEFMLLPTFSIDNWFIPRTSTEPCKWKRCYTIGWLFWFVRWFTDIKSNINL